MDSSKELVDVLVKGGVAVIPTDTIYGVVANAFNDKAVARVYKAKKRSDDKPSIVLIADFEQLTDFGIEDRWLESAIKYWPGPNSLIFPTPRTHKFFVKDNTIALRLPDNDELRQLIRQTGPLIAPSANPEGLPSATTIAQAGEYFGNKVDIYVDGGELTHQPSALINLINSQTLR
jgi:L-threonylcarbamoyladenylate synthase